MHKGPSLFPASYLLSSYVANNYLLLLFNGDWFISVGHREDVVERPKTRYEKWSGPIGFFWGIVEVVERRMKQGALKDTLR